MIDGHEHESSNRNTPARKAVSRRKLYFILIVVMSLYSFGVYWFDVQLNLFFRILPGFVAMMIIKIIYDRV